MTKIKLVFIALLALTLVACGSPEPNEPFLGTWLSDTKITIQKNKDLPSELLSDLKSGKDETLLDISEDTITYSSSKSDGINKMVFKYDFSGSKVNLEIKGKKLAGFFDFKFIPDPAKLTLKASAPEHRLHPAFPMQSGFSLLRDGNYMIFKTRLNNNKIFNIYFIKKKN